MNSENRRLIHLSFGEQQPLRRLLFIVDFVQQTGIKGVVRRLAQAGDTQIMNITADTSAQLFGGGLGKGHHQKFFNGQGTGKGAGTAKPEEQTQIERRDSKGFAGARRSFNQALAREGQAQGIKGLGDIIHSLLSPGAKFAATR